MDQEQSTNYAKLGAIDAKCGALLQLSSLLLVFVSLTSVQQSLTGAIRQGIYKLLVIGLLVSCLIQLHVLWFREVPSRRFVAWRARLFNLAVALTAGCCLTIMVVVGQALLA